LSKENSGSAGPILAKFSPYGSYLIVDYESDLIFPIAQGTLPWQPILAYDEIGLFTFIRRPLAFGKGLQYRTSDFKRIIYADLAASYKHVVNFGLVTPQFKRVKGVHHSSISSLATFAVLLDLAEISTKFFWGDHYSVLFHLYDRGRHCYAARATRYAFLFATF